MALDYPSVVRPRESLEGPGTVGDPTVPVRYEFLRPIVTGWLGQIAQAQKARSGFDAVSQQCREFYSGAIDFMWQSKYVGRYMGGNIKPRFRITIQKAFELVAIFGPVLYWRNPVRIIKPRPQLELSPDMFGDPNDPQVQEMFQGMMQQQMAVSSQENIRNQLMSLVLNYMPDEQPDGGLAQHAETAITEGLVKGRGVLWPRPYSMPGSQRTLTGSFWDTQDNLFIDPDAKSLSSAWWIAHKRTEPVWKVERKFRLKEGSLSGKGHAESRNHYGASQGETFVNLHRSQGKSNDMLVYWEIYSKMGIGNRVSGVNTVLGDEFDRAVGDFAYLAIAADIPYPLNATSDNVRSASDMEIEQMFRWPVPFWKDDKWPCAVLDFYRDPNSAYPIPPMAPGLGELTYINLFMSHLAGRVYSNSRDFIVTLQNVAQYVENTLKNGEDMAVIKIPPGITKTLGEAVQFLKQPEVNQESWHILDRMTHNFELRTGLSELLYGVSRTQSRTATDAEAKQQAVSVRPDYMASKVESWMTEAADMEKFVARWYLDGKDIQELVGPVGAQLWDAHVVSTDPELVVREMRATVEAGSARKPNKQREAQNMQSVMPVLFPELSKHADMTTDTNPLNQLIYMWGKSIDQDVSGFQLGPRQPPQPEPTPEEQQMQQQQMEMQQQQVQLEMAKQQAEAQKLQAEAQKAQADAQVKQADLQGAGPEMADKQAALQFQAQTNQVKMEQVEATHQQSLTQDQEMHQLSLQQKQEEHDLKLSQISNMAAAKETALEEQSRIKSETMAEQAEIKSETMAEQAEIQLEAAEDMADIKEKVARIQSSRKDKESPRGPRNTEGDTGDTK